MALLPEFKKEYGLVANYIGGKMVPSTSTEILDVYNPATDSVIGQVPLSTEEEVDAAVRAAHKAFPEWRATPPMVRAGFMFKLRQVIFEYAEELARIIVQECGKTIQEARDEIRRTLDNIEAACGVAQYMMGYNLEDVGKDIDEYCIRQPLGVFAMIAPFNFPAMVPYWFMPYAIATGNTYIIKPSEQVPLTQTRMFELIHEKVGLPSGVLNMVHGSKKTVDALLQHPLVKGISFVGSTPVAKYIYETAARHGKRVQCQGGAKNCIVVMPDVDIDKAIPSLLSSFFGCAGQRCLAGAILVAVGEVYEPLKEKFVAAAAKLKVGYGLDESTEMGPVISRKHKEKVLSYIETGVKEGAKLLLDGRNIKVEGYPGYFIGPTVFDKVEPDMTIAQEEIFGPVASIIRVNSLKDAINLINSMTYGNGACLYTSNGKWAREFQYSVQCGNIGINLGLPAPVAYFPFSGQRASFFGDLHGQGQDAINFFTERKVVISRWL